MSVSPAPLAASRGAPREASTLAERYRAVRARSIALAAPLSAEDAMVQSMPDASPTKWHLAHTTWFFERFVLGAQPGYVPVDAQWDYLFNSYYNSVGPMHARPRRGLVSRPSLIEVLEYREQVDARMARRFEAGDLDEEAARIILLGTHHEQQHQELLLTDIKHALWCNPLGPAYRDDLPDNPGRATPLRWIARDEAIVEIGAAPWPASSRFAYDNESPRHRVLVPAHALASRPVSNDEYAQFVADGGYGNAELWLSDGWALLRAEGWQRPLYWHEDGTREFTLAGWRECDPHAPACHLSYYEADAFARWAGARLPTEAEWEQAADGVGVDGNFVETGALHPQAADGGGGLQQLFGDVWEWTSSAYTAYPGFRSLPGSLGEYNGKFMSGQWILRGGSCATPRDHVRASYRNFFPPPARWQFSGLRLAKDSA
ncbi:ergothioneine biosynthesis protein EgtB [Luteimonas sp. 22616]|uniref:ergothioneine biosynthesis protein EgtB n=1 Tax=Luteimonas sp. 22616 TaxID=3453951 RepID=UPI003F862384